MPQWISPCIQYIAFYIHPKSYKKIDEYWRTYSGKRKINKVLTNSSRCNTHALTNGATDTKYLPFYKMFKFFHYAKILKIY